MAAQRPGHGRLGRNKVLKAVRGHRHAVVDGHEINHRWHGRKRTPEWLWVTPRTASEVPTRNIVFFGHERRRIENEGFHERCNPWHANHDFHQHPISITAFWLILCIAHAVYHGFVRNLRPALRSGRTVLYGAQPILGDFLADHWAFSSA